MRAFLLFHHPYVFKCVQLGARAEVGAVDVVGGGVGQRNGGEGRRKHGCGATSTGHGTVRHVLLPLLNEGLIYAPVPG
jgi:hypothetical protein